MFFEPLQYATLICWKKQRILSGGLYSVLVVWLFLASFLADAKAGVKQDRERLGTNAYVDGVLTGTVRQVSRNGRMFVLEDETGGVLVNLSQRARLTPGQQIRLKGSCLPTTDYVSFQKGMLIDLDGVHGIGVVSNSIYLRPGRIEIQIPYFNHLGDRYLQLAYHGPNVTSQVVPSAAYSHLETNAATGKTEWKSGLHYQYYEGVWSVIPDFASMKPLREGTVSNLDLTVALRQDDYGILFSGFLQIEHEGNYTFYLDSDDGSELFLGSEAPSIEILGNSASLPAPRKIALGEVSRGEKSGSWVTVEGFVSWAGQREGRLLLDVVSTTGQMLVVIDDPPVGLDQLALRARIQVTGFCSLVEDDDGTLVAGRVWVLSPEDITLKNLPEDYWRQMPAVSIGSLTSVKSSVTNMIYHVAGVAVKPSPYKTEIRDNTGIISVCGIITDAPEDSQVEVYGTLTSEGGKKCLHSLGFRMWNVGEDEEVALPVLTTIEEIRNLSQTEASRGYPVKIRGVRTHEDRSMGMIQDITGGIFVWLMPEGSHLGDYLEIEGETTSGGFAPGIVTKKVRYLGVGPFPEPLRVTWEELMSGSLDSQWVEIKGVVQSSESTNSNVIVSMKDGDVEVRFSVITPQLRRQLNGAVVKIRGTVFCVYDEQTRRFKSCFLRVHDQGQVSVASRALTDENSIRTKTVSELKYFDPRMSPYKPLRVRGQVAGLRRSEGALLEGTNAVRFVLREQGMVNPGDEVEVIGFPGFKGKVMVLRNSTIRKIKSGQLPLPIPVDMQEMESGEFDAHYVSLEGVLINYSVKDDGVVFDLETGSHMVTVVLPKTVGSWTDITLGSRLKISGVLYCQTRSRGALADTFELLVNSEKEVVILETPSWWTFIHTLFVMTALLVILVISLVWIRALRRSVIERTQQLQDEVELHKRTEAELDEKRRLLEDEIEERKLLEVEKDKTHKELMSASREAGMAEVATGVLHNVGNVLNSVNVSTSIVIEKTRVSKTSGVAKVAALLNEHKDDLAAYLTSDEKGRKIPGYLTTLGDAIAQERSEIQKELELLRGNVEHIKEIVATQQDFARSSDVNETIAVKEIIQDAFKMHSSSFSKYGVKFECQCDDLLSVTTDKHRVMQILVNLLQNARQACDGGDGEKKVIVRVSKVGVEWIRIEVIDNGSGIASENLNRIFVHGFTTKKDGHGFGLHSGALAAKSLGGSLSVHSEGVGKGATFTLALPMVPAS